MTRCSVHPMPRRVCCTSRTMPVSLAAAGVGNFVNTALLLILLAVFNVTTVANQKKNPNRLGGVWRTAFGLGLIPIVLILFYRIVFLKVSPPLWSTYTCTHMRTSLCTRSVQRLPQISHPLLLLSAALAGL